MGRLSTGLSVLGVAVVVGVGLLAGCGATDDAPNPGDATATAVFNNADVTFAQQMIVHHRQAVMMAEMAETHAQDPQVKKLAAQIVAEQQPEIETMTKWLQAWGKPVPGMTPGMTSMPSGMPHMPMPSVMPHPSMSHMMGMHGAEFDRMFLTMMIAHHEGAVTMARTELAAGRNPQAKQLAKDIETSQIAQIAQMRRMLASLPTPTPS